MKFKQCMGSIIFLFLFCVLPVDINALVVGSNSLVSRQASALFPFADIDNTMLGFGAFANGFALDDLTTRCTYDDFYPVSDTVNLSGGFLFLKQDVIFGDQTYFINGGQIFGNNYSMTFPSFDSNYTLLTSQNSAVASLVASDTYPNARPQTLDWNMTDDYIAVGLRNASTEELLIYYFDGSTLTVTKKVEEGASVHGVRWHPTLNYLAVGKQDGGNANNLQIYKFTPSSGSLTLTGSSTMANKAVDDVAWHPSGSYLVAATEVSTKELIVYSFNTLSGLATEFSSINVMPNIIPEINAMSFSGNGSYLAVGANYTLGNELQIYSFTSGTLSSTVGLTLGDSVTALDWSPTDDYIAVGINRGSDNLVIYAFDSVGLTLTQVATVTIPYVNVAAWDPTGTLLAVGLESDPSNSDIKIYYFDKANQTLTEVAGSAMDPGDYHNYGLRFSHSGCYLGAGNKFESIRVYFVNRNYPLLFDSINLVFTTDMSLTVPVNFQKNCKISGNGQRLNFQNSNIGASCTPDGLTGGRIIVRPNSTLEIQDLYIDGVTPDNFFCMGDNSAVIFRNCVLGLASDYTFTRGVMLFDRNVSIEGSGLKFVYSSRRTSTINSYSRLSFESGTTFSYDPVVARNNLIFMPDQTAALYFNGCSLQSTRTGMLLSNGSVFFDNKVTMSSEARNTGEALVLDSTSLAINVLGDALLDVYGFVKFV